MRGAEDDYMAEGTETLHLASACCRGDRPNKVFLSLEP
jgi:hypothetical protein